MLNKKEIIKKLIDKGVDLTPIVLKNIAEIRFFSAECDDLIADDIRYININNLLKTQKTTYSISLSLEVRTPVSPAYFFNSDSKNGTEVVKRINRINECYEECLLIMELIDESPDKKIAAEEMKNLKESNTLNHSMIKFFI